MSISMSPSVFKLYLLALSVDDNGDHTFSDERIARVFLSTEVENEDDLRRTMNIVLNERPDAWALLEQLQSKRT